MKVRVRKFHPTWRCREEDDALYLVETDDIGGDDDDDRHCVEAAPEQVDRWRSARDHWLAAQSEMRLLFKQADEVYQANAAEREKQLLERWAAWDSEEARQEREEWKEAEARREAELDERFGPKELFIRYTLDTDQETDPFRIDSVRRVTRRVIHHETCRAVMHHQSLRGWAEYWGEYGVTRLRRPDIEPVADDVRLKTCKKCVHRLPQEIVDMLSGARR